MPSVTGSWRRHESNGSFMTSKPLDVQLMPVGRGFACDGFIQSHVAAGAESQLPVSPTTQILRRFHLYPGCVRCKFT
jgi:hypothetical protein